MTFEYQISHEIEERLKVLLEGLSRGAPTDYPEYCKLVGEIQGLRYSQQAIVKARQHLRPDDEVE